VRMVTEHELLDSIWQQIRMHRLLNHKSNLEIVMHPTDLLLIRTSYSDNIRQNVFVSPFKSNLPVALFGYYIREDFRLQQGNPIMVRR